MRDYVKARGVNFQALEEDARREAVEDARRRAVGRDRRGDPGAAGLAGRKRCSSTQATGP